MDPQLQFLFELIQFDMQQIQNYREAIFNISVATIAASFGLSAFVYRKDNSLSPKYRSIILMGANIVLFIILAGITDLYEDKGLKFTRSTLEFRESALVAHLFEKKPLSNESLYPVIPANHEPRIKSLLERIPLYVAMIIILIKTIVEGVILRKAILRESKKSNPADDKKFTSD